MIPELEYQHATAAVAGVKLNNVAKVLRALLLVAEADDNEVLRYQLESILERSTVCVEGTRALHDKPSDQAIESTTNCLMRISNTKGASAIKDIKLLIRDPFDADNWGNVN